MKRKFLSTLLCLALCLSLLPTALAEGEAPKTYDEAVAELRSGDGYTTEQTFESDYGTVFIYNTGTNPAGQHGFLALVTKAPCAKGEGAIIGLPQPRNSLFCFAKPPHTTELSADKKAFTYSYHYDRPVVSGEGKLLRPAGDFSYIVDLPTGEVHESYTPLGYEKTLAAFTQTEGYAVDELLESPTATAVLRHTDNPAANGDPAFQDYELYLVFKDDNAPEAFRRLLLPSTVYLTHRAYAPTDRAPDSITFSSGNTLNYEYSFQSPLIRPNGDILHEAGIYTYIADGVTGELQASLTDSQSTTLLLDTQAEALAGKLKALGLFLGDEQGNFNLNRVPTRTEALVMLIRVLGEDAQAKAAGKTHPFTDVPAWADGYVSWGYEKGYTKGMSATEFGATSPASCEMYLTFLLRALGYTEGPEADFTYNDPHYLAYQAGVFLSCIDFTDFRRSDVVEATAAALFAGLKDSGSPLWETLNAKGAFTAADFTAQFPTDPNAYEKSLKPLVDAACDYYFEVGQEVNHINSQANLILRQYTDRQGVTHVMALVCAVSADLDAKGAAGTHQYYGLELRFSATGELLERRELPDDDPAWVGANGQPLLDGGLEQAAWASISSAVFVPVSYDETLAELRSSFTYVKESEKSYDTDECTVFVYDRGGAMNTGTGYITIIYKPGSAKGDGASLIPSTPGNERSLLIPRTPDHMELSEDKKTFTYSYHFDEPLEGGGLIVRAAGDFIYTVDLASGEVTENVPKVDESVNTYAASLERVLTDYAENDYVVEKTIEAPLCTLIFYSSVIEENGDRSYLLSAVYKTDVPAVVNGNIWHTSEGSVKSFGLPTTSVDEVSRPGAPMIYTDHMPDSMSLSEDGNTFTLTYDECRYGPYTQTIDLRSGLY